MCMLILLFAAYVKGINPDIDHPLCGRVSLMSVGYESRSATHAED